MYKNIDDAMLGLSTWKKHRREKVSPLSKNIVYKPTFTADCYHEAALYRFIELAESTSYLYRKNQLVAAIVTARSAQETIAVLWFINSKLQSFVKTKNIKQFTKVMHRLVVGWSGEEGFPEKINILNCIDDVDKVMEGKFRRHYNELSEYAHPNYSGTFGAYGEPNHSSLDVIFGEYPRSKDILKDKIESTLIICIELLHHIRDTFELAINEALDVCFKLHEEGELKFQIPET